MQENGQNEPPERQLALQKTLLRFVEHAAKGFFDEDSEKLSQASQTIVKAVVQKGFMESLSEESVEVLITKFATILKATVADGNHGEFVVQLASRCFESTAALLESFVAAKTVENSKRPREDGNNIEPGEEEAKRSKTEQIGTAIVENPENGLDVNTRNIDPSEAAMDTKEKEALSFLPHTGEDGYRFTVITNDGKKENMIWLCNAKEIFSKQLPKMPKEYIVRLVMDKNHQTLICIKDGEVLGGVCFRPYLAQRFAEIAFLAVSATHQVRGVGTLIMNHLKQYVKTIRLTHFLTYADNYAIGYFRKQGFTKTITMPKERWRSYIKDYDGGTLMECAINEYVNYLRIPDMIASQREFLYRKIIASSKHEIIRPGLTLFREGSSVHSLQDQVPGVKEAGWGLPMRGLNRVTPLALAEDNPPAPDIAPGASLAGKTLDEDGKRYYLASTLLAIYRQVRGHKDSWPFHDPVPDSVSDYLDLVHDPIDLSLIKKRLDHGEYYKTSAELFHDLMKMCDNCRIYNSSETQYYKAADLLEAYIRSLYERLHQPIPERRSPSHYPQNPVQETPSGPNIQSESSNTSLIMVKSSTQPSKANKTIPTQPEPRKSPRASDQGVAHFRMEKKDSEPMHVPLVPLSKEASDAKTEPSPKIIPVASSSHLPPKPQLEVAALATNIPPTSTPKTPGSSSSNHRRSQKKEELQGATTSGKTQRRTSSTSQKRSPTNTSKRSPTAQQKVYGMHQPQQNQNLPQGSAQQKLQQQSKQIHHRHQQQQQQMQPSQYHSPSSQHVYTPQVSTGGVSPSGMNSQSMHTQHHIQQHHPHQSQQYGTRYEGMVQAPMMIHEQSQMYHHQQHHHMDMGYHMPPMHEYYNHPSYSSPQDQVQVGGDNVYPNHDYAGDQSNMRHSQYQDQQYYGHAHHDYPSSYHAVPHEQQQSVYLEDQGALLTGDGEVIQDSDTM